MNKEARRCQKINGVDNLPALDAMVPRQSHRPSEGCEIQHTSLARGQQSTNPTCYYSLDIARKRASETVGTPGRGRVLGDSRLLR